MSQINPKLTPKVLRFVEVSSALAKRAMDIIGEKQTREKTAASMRSSLLDLMIEKQAIASNQRGDAEKMLLDHASTMQLLKSAVEKIAQLRQAGETQKKASLGQAVRDPASNGKEYDPQSSLTSPFVGGRTSQKKASDVAFERILQPPTS